MLLASYDDMNYASFWHVLETIGDYEVAPSTIREPLTGPTRMPVDSALATLLIKQLAEVHGASRRGHTGAAGGVLPGLGAGPVRGRLSRLGGALRHLRRDGSDPRAARADPRRPVPQTYVIGSCYSFDQGWVEGALCTAESVLQEFLGLAPLNSHLEGYTLVCHTQKPPSTPDAA